MSKAVIIMTLDDALHYSEEERAGIIASYPAHERDARTKGIPSMGSGRVFPYPEEQITCAPFPIPNHWPQINGLDFGIDHPFASTNLAWDRDADIIYVCKEYRERGAIPSTHIAAVKPWGDWIPCAWPHDGLQKDKHSGVPLADHYRNGGLKLLKDKATHPPQPGEEEGTGDYGVEAGILDMQERMETGRWKVFTTCGGWLEEFRLYHRKDGQIVKVTDDLISSSRYAYMMKRHAITKPRPSKPLEIPKYGTAV